MVKSETAQELSKAFDTVGVSAEQAMEAAQKLAEAARKALTEIKPQKRIVERCACAICNNSRVTLLKREGTYFCGPCYRKLLTLRALGKQQQKEQAEI